MHLWHEFENPSRFPVSVSLKSKSRSLRLELVCDFQSPASLSLKLWCSLPLLAGGVLLQ